MNDFLHKLRNTNPNEKRYMKNRRQIDRGYYDNKERRNGNDRRDDERHSDKYKKQFHTNQKKPHYRTDDQNESIIKLLEVIANNQTQMIDINERRVMAEEQKAQAFQEISINLKQYFSAATSKPEALQPQPDESQQSDVYKMVNEEIRQKIVRIIIDMRKKDSTYGEIAEELDKAGFPTFSGKGKWHAQTVHRIFRQNQQEN